MSAYLMDNKSLSIITNIIKRDLITGQRVNMNMERLFGNKSEKDIFHTLFKMNIMALEMRYGNGAVSNEEIVNGEYIPMEDLYKVSNYGDVMDWMYKVIRILDTYLYQCTEGSVPETDYYKAIDTYRNNWYRYIVQHTAAYNSDSGNEIYIIVEDGRVSDVYSNNANDDTWIEIIDMDTQDPDEREALEEEASEIRNNKFYKNLY